MKPSKCLIFCRDARRSKALFETEAKAMAFIKYNRYAIKRKAGFAPVRAYHCTSCDGWHVTSRKAVFDVPDKAEVMIAAYNREHNLDWQNKRDRLREQKREQRREQELEQKLIQEREQEAAHLLKARIRRNGPLMALYKQIEEIHKLIKSKTDKTRTYKAFTKAYQKLGIIMDSQSPTTDIQIIKDKLDSIYADYQRKEK